jgi:hypothetical protein
MSETYNEEQVEKIVSYIQKKERRLSALNTAINGAVAPIYGQELAEIAKLVYEDKVPCEGLVDTSKSFKNLYPRAAINKQEEKKEDKEYQ